MRRRYRRIKRPYPCPQCAFSVLNHLSSRHQRSVYHRNVASIRELLETGAVSFAEIGQRLGVTREYVRQLAGHLGLGKRRRAWSIERRKTEALERNPLLAEVIREAEKYGLAAKLIKCKPRIPTAPYRISAVRIGRFHCAVRTLWLQYRDQYRLTFLDKQRPDFLLAKSPHGWMVVPGDKLPDRGSTAFILGREKRSPGSRSSRHDWPHYLNAWDLLRRGSGVQRNLRDRKKSASDLHRAPEPPR